MATVGYVKDHTSYQVVQAQAGGNNVGIYTGSEFSRSTSGGDRAAGSIPGFKAHPVMYQTREQLRTVYEKRDTWVKTPSGMKIKKARVARVEVVRPSQQKVRYVWKREPNRSAYEQEHSYSGWRCTVHGQTALVNMNGTPSGWSARHPQVLKDLCNAIGDYWTTNESNANIGKLREQIAGSDFNLAIALGESPKALKMVAEHTTRIFSAFVAVKKGNISRAVKLLVNTNPTLSAREKKRNLTELGYNFHLTPRERAKNSKLRTLEHPIRINGRLLASDFKRRNKQQDSLKPIELSRDDVAGNWLALQYGWRPLVQDIYGAAVFVDHHLRNPTTKTYRTRRYYLGDQKPFKFDLWYGSGTSSYFPVWLLSSQDIIAKLEEKNVARLSGLLDPATLAWELLPYSFVIDWFVPIGNYLSARGLSDSITGTFITVRRTLIEGQGRGVVSYSKQIHSVYNGRTTKLIYTRVARTVSTSLAVPTPNIQPLSKVASWQHAANAVALLTKFKG